MEFLHNLLGMLASASDYLNPVIDRWFPFLLTAIVILTDLIWLVRWMYREGLNKGLLRFSRTIFYEGGIVFFLALLPKLIALFILIFIFLFRRVIIQPPESVIRWILLYLSSLFIFNYTREHGGRRGLFSYLGHVTVFLIGWLAGKWSGILFLSIPLLVVYYIGVYYYAQAILPIAHPEGVGLHFSAIPRIRKAWGELRRKDAANPKRFLTRCSHFLITLIDATQWVGGENWKRFLILVWYTWGVQYPLIVITDSFGRESETRIAGNGGRSIGRPGLIHAQAHQAIGITTGIRFARVAGPGTVFIEHRERLFEVVDLRPQSRSNEIEAISKDGNPFKAGLSATFAIDRQKWSLADFHRLKLVNPILADGREFVNEKGSFPFSPARVRAALSTTGIEVNPQGQETIPVHWDNRVMSQLEEAARFVLAQRNLDELWRPHHDKRGASALTEISAEIISLTRPRLQEQGVNLIAARIDNFIFPKDHPIIEQQIKTWSTLWQQRADQVKARGQAEAGRLQQEAKAYARSIILTSLAEGIQKTNVSRPDLARNIIALRFIGALEELIQQQPSETREEYLKRLENYKQQILLSRMKG